MGLKICKTIKLFCIENPVAIQARATHVKNNPGTILSTLVRRVFIQGSRAVRCDPWIPGCTCMNSDFDGQIVDMRVGIHSGRVIYGIVGRKRYKFDVYSKGTTESFILL